MGDGAVRRFLGLSVMALLCALALRPATADPTTDKNAAIEELLEWALVNDQLAEDIEEALTTPDAYVFVVESAWEGIFPLVVNKQQVDTFVGYLQVQNLLNPETIDQQIPKAARAVGLDEWVVKQILEDRKAVLATGGAAVAHEKLRQAAEKARPDIDAYVKQLRAEADALVAEAQKIGGISSWPPTKESGTANVFSPVEVGGVTVDYCLSFAADCGQPVADQFCQNNGFTKATSFEWQYMHPTRTLRSGESCDADYCGGFTKIVCE